VSGLGRNSSRAMQAGARVVCSGEGISGVGGGGVRRGRAGVGVWGCGRFSGLRPRQLQVSAAWHKSGLGRGLGEGRGGFCHAVQVDR
jgi:hypothetical protein